ncbi:hypothetical protein CH63R_10800 [Colletotrichum higginsianum IMI 349063]|uniref:Uncharacterized protein n=1 Tax=Colletotrichum higginsianum (strain IMI 349063) TaxID=759273 RepID=A0A1B7Y3T8_COLHI|nr:uncharacterized protein CH63R_10800 [Colletotrichum higginsianum IMI 349063]OBR06680.1 hypothetical protein CH63R_10800 [Colletotrichum higginsianum IMI 349063]
MPSHSVSRSALPSIASQIEADTTERTKRVEDNNNNKVTEYLAIVQEDLSRSGRLYTNDK